MKIFGALITGAFVGFVFPMIFIYLDLHELSMTHSWKNIIWVVQSQNLITFAFYALPIVFSMIFLLFMLNIEKSKEIKRTSVKMANMAHAAGMGEIAAEVIHNIGNVLTSVLASIEKTSGIIHGSKYNTAGDAEKLLDEKKHLFKDAFSKDSKLEQLIDYYILYTKTTVQEYESISEEVDKLKTKLAIIRDILMTQKSYAYSKAYNEKTDAGKLVAAAVRIFQEKIQKYNIDVRIKFDEFKEINTQTGKVVNILSNLIKNAIEAMEETEKKFIEISSSNCDDWVKISVRDSGPGISDEMKKQIFTYGYTTKKKGAGLGLHSCFNLANSLDGKFVVEDPENGPGAVFCLYLPNR